MRLTRAITYDGAKRELPGPVAYFDALGTPEDVLAAVKREPAVDLLEQRAEAFVEAELEHAITPRVGVHVRTVDHEDGSRTLQISISEYVE